MCVSVYYFVRLLRSNQKAFSIVIVSQQTYLIAFWTVHTKQILCHKLAPVVLSHIFGIHWQFQRMWQAFLPYLSMRSIVRIATCFFLPLRRFYFFVCYAYEAYETAYFSHPIFDLIMKFKHVQERIWLKKIWFWIIFLPIFLHEMPYVCLTMTKSIKNRK